MRAILPVLLLIGGCVEYDILAPAEIHGVNNPKPLETPLDTDRLVQRTVPKVDILWTLDNSGSMVEEADKIVANFPVFLEYFLGSGLDYHIGIISTNLLLSDHQGKLLRSAGYKWVDDQTVNPLQVFADMVPYYPGQTHPESGRGAVYAALELQSVPNDGFLRDDAGLHIVVITDEVDQTEDDLISVAEFVNFLEGLKPDLEGNLSFSSIVGINVPCNGAFERGETYLQITQQIGGIAWSICEDDWRPVVDALGLQAAGLGREFFLARQPVVDTIRVTVLEDAVLYEFSEGNDWIYSASRNSITFVEYVPSALAEVQITYEDLSALEL